jgi:hypothetical protein
MKQMISLEIIAERSCSLDVPLTEVVGRRARDFARGLAQRIGYSKRRRAECNAPSFQFNTNLKKSWQERLEIATGRFAGTFNEVLPTF